MARNRDLSQSEFGDSSSQGPTDRKLLGSRHPSPVVEVPRQFVSTRESPPILPSEVTEQPGTGPAMNLGSSLSARRSHRRSRFVDGTRALFLRARDWCPHYQGQLGILDGAETITAPGPLPTGPICHPFYLEVAEDLDQPGATLGSTSRQSRSLRIRRGHPPRARLNHALSSPRARQGVRAMGIEHLAAVLDHASKEARIS